MGVAPHTGARIETWVAVLFGSRLTSPLTQGRGSKHNRAIVLLDEISRPSHRGADRNLHRGAMNPARKYVAPHTGARIETSPYRATAMR